MTARKQGAAAPTLEVHDATVAREGARLGAIAAARNQGRRRKGLNPDDIRRMVRALQDSDPWERIVKREAVYIEPEVLEKWKPDLEKLAFEPPGPVLPGRG